MQLFKLMYRASVQEMNKFDDMMAYLKRSLREQGQARKLPKFSRIRWLRYIRTCQAGMAALHASSFPL